MIKEYSNTLVSLLKGVVYTSNHDIWENMLKYEDDVRTYFDDIHMELFIDTSEGYAFLKQQKQDETPVITDKDEEPKTMVKLIDKRSLTFHVSLLCLLLRNHLIENDSVGTSTRAMLKKAEIIVLMSPFMKESTNEVRQIAKIEATINKVIDEGFLRKVKDDEELYEVNRIIKAFVNADVVQTALQNIKDYSQRIKDNE